VNTLNKANSIPVFFKHPFGKGGMTVQEGKEKFIESWGKMASEWGINRTMAQVHALLLIAPEPLTADQVMEALNISRGNANMNLRALLDWGLVHKQLKAGERKEYFYAEKEMWTVVRQIMIQRKKRELEPMLKVLEEVANVEANCPESESFTNVVKDIRMFSNKANQTLDALIKSDANWFTNVFLHMVR
jgi:DNA-binding transcriptional regulator GbsR (MarR family)